VRVAVKVVLVVCVAVREGVRRADPVPVPAWVPVSEDVTVEVGVCVVVGSADFEAVAAAVDKEETVPVQEPVKVPVLDRVPEPVTRAVPDGVPGPEEEGEAVAVRGPVWEAVQEGVPAEVAVPETVEVPV